MLTALDLHADEATHSFLRCSCMLLLQMPHAWPSLQGHHVHRLTMIDSRPASTERTPHGAAWLLLCAHSHTKHCTPSHTLAAIVLALEPVRMLDI